ILSEKLPHVDYPVVARNAGSSKSLGKSTIRSSTHRLIGEINILNLRTMLCRGSNPIGECLDPPRAKSAIAPFVSKGCSVATIPYHFIIVQSGPTIEYVERTPP